MDPECTFEERAAQPTLVIRTRAAVQQLPDLFVGAFTEIMEYLTELGSEPVGMPFGAYRNMDMQDLDLEIGFPVARPFPSRGRIAAAELPGGQWATLLHIGPYDQVGPTWGRLAAAIGMHGRTISGPAYEFYLTGPTTPPEDTQSLLAFPVTGDRSDSRADGSPSSR